MNDEWLMYLLENIMLLNFSLLTDDSDIDNIVFCWRFLEVCPTFVDPFVPWYNVVDD